MSTAVDVTKPDGTRGVDPGACRFDGAGSCLTEAALRAAKKGFTIRKTSDTTRNILNPDGTRDPKLTTQ